MTEVPCKKCVLFALCKAKGPFDDWQDLSPVYKECIFLLKYLNKHNKSNYLLESKRLYETLELFKS